jgi:REP element-mobilizing transposase RayT
LRHDNFIPNITIKSRGRLPHWQVDDAVYFVTFRLRDALPRDIARSLFIERDRMLRNASTDAERARLDQAFGVRLDSYLDHGYGSCILREHGDLVASALQHFDRSRYELHAWCVMPNHVHVMVHIGVDVPDILHSWKSYTAHRMNRGVVWQREYFDRVVRSPAEFNDTRQYIHANPYKAGLKNWKWVG